jgi:hypothetical protein
MYTEDDLFDELTGSVKQTAHNVKTAIDAVNHIKNMANKEATNLLSVSNPSFVFTGQGTDLRYFEHFKEMPISMIENIQDENLKNAVKQEFNKAALSGKVEISKQTGKITITNAGKEFIKNPVFKAAAAKDYQAVMGRLQETVGFELNGTISDLSFFNHSKTLDLNTVMAHPDKKTVQKVLSNLVKMKKQGLVTVEGSLVKATKKGKEMLASKAFKGVAKGVVTKAASTAANAAAASTGVGAIFVAIKTAVQVTAKVVSSAAQQK